MGELDKHLDFRTSVFIKRVHDNSPSTIYLSTLVRFNNGFGCLIFLGSSIDLTLLVISQSLFSLGISAIFTLITDVVIERVPAERAGLAASMSESSFELGGALGIAILGSIGAVIYRNGIATSGFGSEIGSADTLGGTVVSASSLPVEQAAELLALAREAFTNGMHWAAGISVLVSLMLAIICMVALRKV